MHPETGLHANLTTLLDLTRYIHQRDLPHPVSQGQLWGVPIIISGAFGSLCFDASSLHMQQSAWQPPPPSSPLSSSSCFHVHSEGRDSTRIVQAPDCLLGKY